MLSLGAGSIQFWSILSLVLVNFQPKVWSSLNPDLVNFLSCWSQDLVQINSSFIQESGSSVGPVLVSSGLVQFWPNFSLDLGLFSSSFSSIVAQI